jgi:hypothetical protein
MAEDNSLLDQLRELECQSIQTTLFIQLQSYDIIDVGKERQCHV